MGRPTLVSGRVPLISSLASPASLPQSCPGRRLFFPAHFFSLFPICFSSSHPPPFFPPPCLGQASWPLGPDVLSASDFIPHTHDVSGCTRPHPPARQGFGEAKASVGRCRLPSPLSGGLGAAARPGQGLFLSRPSRLCSWPSILPWIDVCRLHFSQSPLPPLCSSRLT